MAFLHGFTMAYLHRLKLAVLHQLPGDRTACPPAMPGDHQNAHEADRNDGKGDRMVRHQSTENPCGNQSGQLVLGCVSI